MEFALGGVNARVYRRNLSKRNLLLHSHVLDLLRKYFEVTDQFCQRLPCPDDDIHQAERSKQAVASSGFAIAENNMARLLTAKSGAGLEHFLEHIFVADVGPQHADAGLFQGNLQTHV